MTDLRIPERYLVDRRVARLSPTDFTSFVMASLWSVSNRTDGQLEPDDLGLIPMFNPTSIPVLMEKGLWTHHSSGWLISDYTSTQTSRHDLEVLDNARRADREKKARLRAEKKSNGAGQGPSFSEAPRDDPRDTSPGGHRTGQAGKESEREDTWYVAPIPKTCRVCAMSLTADFPVDVCPKQDAEHTAARRPAA